MKKTMGMVLLVVACSAMVMVGCKKDKTNKTTEAAKTTQGEADTKVAKGAAPASDISGPCGEWQKTICQEAGPASLTCTSVKTSVKLMGDAACSAAMKDISHAKLQLEEMKKVCTSLTEKLCADVGEDTDSCKMVQTRLKKFPPDKCQQMADPKQYGQVVAQLKRQEAMNKPLPAEKTAALTAGNVPFFGSETAPVTIVEFSDFECPYCSRAADIAKQIKEKFPNKVRFVFRQFPLSFHKNAHLAAQASLAANDQGKFWAYHDLLFANQKALSRADLDKYAKEVGLDFGKFKTALDSGQFKDAVDADMKLGGEVFVSGTPSMFLNGKRLQNWQDMNALTKQIEAAAAGK